MDVTISKWRTTPEGGARPQAISRYRFFLPAVKLTGLATAFAEGHLLPLSRRRSRSNGLHTTFTSPALFGTLRNARLLSYFGSFFATGYPDNFTGLGVAKLIPRAEHVTESGLGTIITRTQMHWAACCNRISHSLRDRV